MSATNDVLTQNYNPYARREDAPLPPIPSSSPTGRRRYSQDEGHSTTSPFSDNAYPAYPKPGQPQPQQPPAGAASDYYTQGQYAGQDPHYGADTHYQGYQGYQNYQPDPFDDRHAIPLQQHKPGAGGHYGEEEVHPAAASFDRRDHAQGRHNDGSRKRGWFSKPVPWVVYTLTTIQIIVFIAELIRNGEWTCLFPHNGQMGLGVAEVQAQATK